MVADDRSSSFPGISALPPSRHGAELQSATFDVGSVRLELHASPGTARLVLEADGNRETHVIDPAALAAWSAATSRLLALSTATTPEQRAEFRAPYLLDREGRASIAFEGLVSEGAVAYRMLVCRGPDTITGVMTTAGVTRSVAEAAAGAAAVARAT